MIMKASKRKEKIEQNLLDAMHNLDEATGSMLALDTDTANGHASEMAQAKQRIRRVLQHSYDQCARNRN